MNIKIVYYSGTGGTARVAKCFKAAFEDAGQQVNMQQLSKNAKIEECKCELLILLYPVYAFSAPKAVYQWIDGIEAVNNISAVIVSVSGGGEIVPNTACRVGSIKRLEKKGYKVIYEQMLVLPSNFVAATPIQVAKMLLDVLPKRVDEIVLDICNGVKRRTKPFLIDRIFSFVGKIENFGARYFGKRIKIKEGCNGCGWCSMNCPAGNIIIEGGSPKFGGECHLCLKCIYGCPKKALIPGTAAFIVIKDGYNLKQLEEMPFLSEEIDLEKLVPGYLWSGVRKYLLRNDVDR